MDSRPAAWASMNRPMGCCAKPSAVVRERPAPARAVAGGDCDLSDRHTYRLSRPSKDIVGALQQDIIVRAYLSSDLPSEFASTTRFVRDLLDQYRRCSNGRLRFEVQDPSGDQRAEEQAKQCNLETIRIQVRTGDTTEVRPYFLGLCFDYGGKQDLIEKVLQGDGLEYRVSATIKRMSVRKRRVAFTTGHGEQDLDRGFTALRHGILQEFEYVTVDPSTRPIGTDVDALVVGGPRLPFDDKGRRAIDAFLMRGKGALFLLDGTALSPMTGEASNITPAKIGRPIDSGLGEMLEKYGFKVNQDRVLDRQNAPGIVELADGRRMLRQCPTFVTVTPDKGRDPHFMLGGVEALVFPFTSSVDLVGPLASDGRAPDERIWTLARTSPTAWRETGTYTFSASTKCDERPAQGSFSLAYAYQGPLTTAYPAPGGSSDTRRPVRLVVVGGTAFSSDEYVMLARYVPAYMGGGQLVLNAISWVLEDEALAPIRAKRTGVGGGWDLPFSPRH